MSFTRNFAIVAHVDHGKSTLADRLLEFTNTISDRRMRNQLLDSNPIERERGITIKLAPVRMTCISEGQEYVFNLIDTPGHVDFSYEVNRSLAACEGAILLVDATQGVQAQTLAHFQQASKLGLAIIPVINKIDISTADVTGTRKQLVDIFGFSDTSIINISAKSGQGVPELVQAIIDRIPQPNVTNFNGPFRGLVFNSSFDPHLGILTWIRVFDGQIATGQKISFLATGADASSVELGHFIPERHQTKTLLTGDVGYIVTGLRESDKISVGDTVCLTDELASGQLIVPLTGYQPINPLVYVSFYPVSGVDISALRDALDKLHLQDSSIQYMPEFSSALGNGFRVGLLGLLHADIVQERIEREFGLDLIAAAPSVEYEIVMNTGKILRISKASDLPDPSNYTQIREPVISLSIFVPAEFAGQVIQLCQDHRGTMLDMKYLSSLVHFTYSLPLAELIQNFYDQLKSVSHGYATLDYELSGFVGADLTRLDILISGEIVEALSQIVPKTQSANLARKLVEKLKDIVPRQQFEIAIQAAIGSHVLARADVKAFRKDVTAKLYGGDQTRKDKLLKKQKKGKARMKRVGRIDLPQEAFLSILKIN